MGFINIEQLVALRTAKGWDQKQLAEAAGVDRSVISRLERGLQADCRVSVLVAIAYALDVAPEYLINRGNKSIRLDLAPEFVASLVMLEQSTLKVQRQAALILNAFIQGLNE